MRRYRNLIVVALLVIAAATLAGVIDLPNEATAVASAVAYSAGNMPAALYGSVLKAGVPEE